MPNDHYATLGVDRRASADEIKKAYRRLAREHHPDANRHDPESAERFKKIGVAYQALSDPEKRRRYDLYGDGGEPDLGDFSGLSDLFSSFFGGATGASPRGGAGQRGADIVADIEITLEDAAAGVERDVEITTQVECSECAGSGAAPGTFPSACLDCNGSGEIHEVRRTFFGNVMTASTCYRCGGTGRQVLDPCRVCSGAGRIQTTETLTVGVPAGIENGSQMRITGRGGAGLRRGPTGNFYVTVRVAEHPVFKRGGEDLGCEVSVPMTVAALGGSVDVPTLDGSERVDVAPGTQSGVVVKLKNKGMPRLDGRGRGEIVAWLRVETPRNLTEEQKDLLARFATARNEEVGDQSLFGRIKEAFH